MSEHDIDDEPRAQDDEAATPRDRPDPRKRPPDPAGTQPKWDPDELLPSATPRAAAGRLWATPAEGEDGDGDAGDAADGTDRERVGATATATADAAPEGSAAAASAADDAPRYPPHSARFQFLLGALLAVGVASVALLVAVLAGGGKSDTTIVLKAGPAWSPWHPDASSGTEAANQIASHVGAQYKLPNGHQLVGVLGGPLEVQQVPVTIAIQQPAAQGGQVDFLDDGAGVMYRMNGIGTADSRIPGRPSTNRHMLLRREALELALYSFRYLGVSKAVVLFPPSVRATRSATTGKLVQTKAAPTALLFRRDQNDVQNALVHPLNSTLSSETPSVSGVTRSRDARTVEALTNSRAYTYKLQEANTDLRLFLVLAPLRIR